MGTTIVPRIPPKQSPPAGALSCMRTLVPVLLLLTFTGCTILDRESYSLIIRKKSHRYRKLSTEEKERIEQVRATADQNPFTRCADHLPAPRGEVNERVPDFYLSLVPFRPFVYCHHHESSHIFESVTAILAAPVEYPLAMTASVVVGPLTRPGQFGWGSDDWNSLGSAMRLGGSPDVIGKIILLILRTLSRGLRRARNW